MLMRSLFVLTCRLALYQLDQTSLHARRLQPRYVLARAQPLSPNDRFPRRRRRDENFRGFHHLLDACDNFNPDSRQPRRAGFRTVAADAEITSKK
jgi:hypothetical protein